MDWLITELQHGLMKLLSLGMDRTPASDVIEVTVGTWYEALTHGRSWNQERDTPRIRHAFSTLFNTCDRWPQPKHLADALPRVEQAALSYEVKPLSPEQAAQRMAEIKKMLDEPMPQHDASKVKPEREGPPLSEVEANLRQHYGTGKMAAAGPDL